ncbi:uncharacterized protein N7479_002633 [Penicillium vulpinum]|uniref:uncharacterized protein n=1 Tax=Penicillium vulpinum TaxID=29845 RepID=UPI002546DB54|nr:uncharacterized protein N7479_002633 [Penicillium vulpinum]KAJ5972715.1 hypothetical protein N7479_002633 [Penicillium vulpinum]
MPSTSSFVSPSLSNLVPTTSTRLIFSRGALGSSEPSTWVTLSLSSYSLSRAVTLFRNLAVDDPLKSYIAVAAIAYAADQSLHNTLTNHVYNKGDAQFPNFFALDRLEYNDSAG